MRRRPFEVVVAAVTLTALLAACGGTGPAPATGEGAEVAEEAPSTPSSELEPGAKEEGSLTWYTSKPTEIVDALAEDFTNQYGIKVDIYKAGGSQVLAKVEAELMGGGLKADVVDYSDAGAAVAQADRGIFAQYAPQRSELVDPQMQSSEGQWSSYGPYAAMIAYNPKLVSASEAPKSWQDLTDPKWKGKVGMASPDYAGSAFMTMQGWEQMLGEDFLGKIGPNLRVFQGFGDVQNALLSGQAPVGVVLSFRAYADKDSGAPIEVVSPKEGAVAVGEAYAINAEAQHPQAARLFANYLLSEPAQAIVAEHFLFPGTSDVAPRSGVPSLQDLKTVYPDLQQLSDPDRVAELKQKFKSETS